jgi:hypothetical protein
VGSIDKCDSCQTCRRRKIRCDGTKPICTTCAENGHSCLGYSDGPQVKAQRRKSDDHDEDAVIREGGHSIMGSPHTTRTEASTYHGSVDLNDDSRLQDGRGSDSYDGSNSTPGQLLESQSPPFAPLESRRVPYFRYFGPTAIVPGYKQMVVSVRDHRRSSTSGLLPAGM